jgi:hypothetical protein
MPRSSASNGGIMGSGVYGHVGTFITCKSEDNSTYCNIMKVVNVIMGIFFVCVILYFVYNFFFSKKGKR